MVRLRFIGRYPQKKDQLVHDNPLYKKSGPPMVGGPEGIQSSRGRSCLAHHCSLRGCGCFLRWCHLGIERRSSPLSSAAAGAAVLVRAHRVVEVVGRSADVETVHTRHLFLWLCGHGLRDSHDGFPEGTNLVCQTGGAVGASFLWLRQR